MCNHENCNVFINNLYVEANLSNADLTWALY